MDQQSLTRGDIVVVADRRGDFSGKPRPAIVMQRSDAVAYLPTVTVCLLTSQPSEAPLLRPVVPATAETGLETPSWALIDQLQTVRRGRAQRRIGRLDAAKMLEISQALVVFLGIADGRPAAPP